MTWSTVVNVEKLDPDDSRPPYRQVVEAIRAEIHAGQLGPGEKLASHADMATDFGVSVGTVKRAISVLQNEGLIVSRQGQGAYVRTRAGESGPGPDGEVAELRRAVGELAGRLDAVERRLADL